MPDKTQPIDSNPLILQTVYPDAASIFSFQPEPLRSLLEHCLVVLDTNVLLVPYNTGKDSLAEVEKTYATLTAQKRLIVPAQVAREFAQNRSEKLKTVFQQLSLKRNLSVKKHPYPLLESIEAYREFMRLESELDAQLTAYRKAIAELLDQISSWHWNDPVSSLYRRLFSENVVHEPTIDDSEFLADLDRRQLHKIPPGYKDAAKDDRGVGDLLIWRTILELGKQRQRNVVFVSGDEKADWWHQSEGRALFPRFELIDEFRRESEGKSFYIISFAQLLENFGASTTVVEEVRQEEAAAGSEPVAVAEPAPSLSGVQAEKAVYRWLRERYRGSHVVVQRAAPDFVVYFGGDLYGYDVHIASRAKFRAVVEHLQTALLRPGAPPLTKLYAVFVAPTERVFRVIGYEAHRSARLYPGIGVIVGIVQGATFVERVRIEAATEPPTK